jgi:DNA-binding response OmpR family regulator
LARVLVVEDERELSALVRQELRHAGQEVEAAFDGPSGVSAVERFEPDLIVLDVMLPGFDGLVVLRRVRVKRATPILMLTARATELDKVLGLELGADDYLTKPFSMRELLARVSAILRRVELIRSRSESTLEAERIEAPGLMIDLASHEVFVDTAPVGFTATEFRLLRLLAGNPGRVFSREYLLEEVWGGDVTVFDRTVDSHIQRVRKKLGPKAGEMIETVWGVGYRFNHRAKP